MHNFRASHTVNRQIKLNFSYLQQIHFTPTLNFSMNTAANELLSVHFARSRPSRSLRASFELTPILRAQALLRAQAALARSGRSCSLRPLLRAQTPLARSGRSCELRSLSLAQALLRAQTHLASSWPL